LTDMSGKEPLRPPVGRVQTGMASFVIALWYAPLSLLVPF